MKKENWATDFLTNLTKIYADDVEILEIIEEVNISPEYIDVEITETAFMQNMDYNIEIMKKLSNFMNKLLWKSIYHLFGVLANVMSSEEG